MDVQYIHNDKGNGVNKMYAIVRYTDNTMENYKVICFSNDLHLLDIRLQNLRKLSYYSNDKPIYRIIKM